MNENHGQYTAAIWLPVAMAKNRYARSNFYETFLRSREGDFSHQEESRQGLQVASAQKAARPERRGLEDRLRRGHTLILNRDSGSCRT